MLLQTSEFVVVGFIWTFCSCALKDLAAKTDDYQNWTTLSTGRNDIKVFVYFFPAEINCHVTHNAMPTVKFNLIDQLIFTDF